MNTTDKQKCIDLINSFIKNPTEEKAVSLIEFYIKDEDNETINLVRQSILPNINLLSFIMPVTLKKLGEKYELTELSKNNNLIKIL